MSVDIPEGTETTGPVVDYSTYGMTEPETNVSSQPELPADQSNSQEEYPAAWAPILADIPKEFHGKIAPKLKSWDQGVSQRFQKIHEEYAPLKQFRDNGVTPEQLQNAWEISQALENDPVDFNIRLRDMLVAQGRIQEAEAVQDKIEAQQEEDDPYTAQIQQLRSQQEQFQQTLQQAYLEEKNEQVMAEARSQVDAEIADLTSKIGQMSPAYLQEIGTRASIMGQQQHRIVSLQEAHEATQRLIQFGNQSRPGANAPRVSAGGGSLPAKQPTKFATADERKAAARQIIEGMQGS